MTCGEKVYKSMGSITMKMLVTGGNRGLGQHLVDVFGADSVSRATNLDITMNKQSN
jgi:dTDP-4-dehydrorhamnose reductase